MTKLNWERVNEENLIARREAELIRQQVDRYEGLLQQRTQIKQDKKPILAKRTIMDKASKQTRSEEDEREFVYSVEKQIRRSKLNRNLLLRVLSVSQLNLDKQFNGFVASVLIFAIGSFLEPLDHVLNYIDEQGELSKTEGEELTEVLKERTKYIKDLLGDLASILP
jgi:hypothetical protein